MDSQLPFETEVLLAIRGIESGVQRVEEKIDALERKTDASLNRIDSDIKDAEAWLVRHEKQLQAHDTAIKVIENRLGPRLSVIAWVAGLASLAAVVLAVLDRLYGV